MTTLAQAAPARSFTEVWVISVGHALTHWYPATFYVLLPLIGHELGLNYSQIGSILSVQYAAGAISNVPGGLIVDSTGRKGLLLALSLFWVGVPYLLMGIAGTYWALLTCAALVGIGNNLWHPVAIPLLGNHFPERRGLVMSFHGMAANVGDATAPLAAGALLTILNWREVVVVNVVPGVAMAILILLYVGRLQTAPHGAAGSSAGAHDALKRTDMPAAFRALLTNRAVIMLSVGSAFRTLTQSTLLTFLPVYLAGQLGYSPIVVGVCLFAMQAAGFTAAPIAGHLSDRMGRRDIIMTSLGLSAVILLFMAFAGQSPAFVFLVAILGFFLFATRAVLQAWLLDATPRNMGGTSVGFMFGLQAAGAAVGPVIGGLLADQFGLLATFYFLAATIIVANFFIFFTPPTAQQAASSAA